MRTRVSGRFRLTLVDAPAEASLNLEQIYRQYGTYLRDYVARTFGPGPPEPEEVAHAAFERLIATNKVETVENPRAFLVRSARNLVIDNYRRQKVRRAHHSLVISTEEETGDFDAERVLIGKERLEVLRQAIDGLDDRRREVLIMHRIHGMKCAEIAKKLDRSPSLVKLLIAEALVHCRDSLKKADGE